MKERKPIFQKHRGMTLIELLGVMAVIAIISVIAIGGITAARDSANETSVQSDIRTYQTAVQQALVQHPEIMKFREGKPGDAAEVLMGYINDQLEEQWRFEAPATASTDCGGIATSEIKRDAWNNPYGLYVYFDDQATSYTDKNGQPLKESDSCVYIVVASAGKNATGGPVGFDGNNLDADRKIASAAAMVNNTDGIDDIGTIVRVLNGNVYTATFGLEKATLGRLEGINWIFGDPKTAGGICYDFAAATEKSGGTIKGGSLDDYYDAGQLPPVSGGTNQLIGTWS